ncbi:MAG: DedD protein [Oceanicoccus sp.]|jgi:DedD protein
MNDGFKQRLVGAIVLVSIALIVWPLVFTDLNHPIVDTRSEIPVVPEFRKYSVPEPNRVKGLTPIVKPTAEPIAAKPKATIGTSVSAKPTAKPRQDKTGLPEAWVLQVASFTKFANADELKRDLQKSGHKAFTRKINAANGQSTRVYIGPKLNKNAFDKDKAAIDKRYKVVSLVVRFDQ